jgi:hypothetical protein
MRPIYRNTTNNILFSDVTKTSDASEADDLTITWTLKTKDGVTTIASGNAVQVDASNTYRITVAMSDATDMILGRKYILALTDVDNGLGIDIEYTAQNYTGECC